VGKKEYMRENNSCGKALTNKQTNVSHLSIKNNIQMQEVNLIRAFKSLSGVLYKAKKEWYKMCPQKITECMHVSFRSD
jgi:hypothetical protein